MTTLEAIYENGIFKPISGSRPTLKEHERVRITIETGIDEKAETKNGAARQELWQKLFAEGLITHIPSGISDDEDDFEPVEIEGESISETIIRERG